MGSSHRSVNALELAGTGHLPTRPGSRLGRNSMLAQMTCEGLAPSMERHLTDVEPFAIFAEGFEDNMHMGVRLIRVERQGVSMPRREYLLCEIAHGRQESVGRGSRWHRENDFMDQLLARPAAIPDETAPAE
jgi:hypothetical protein